jgi:alkylation response protein AidB-like acyl-CoA dehydrogenase
VDFDFSPEQIMLRDLARQMLAEQSPPSEVRRLMEDPLGYSQPLWEQLAATGLQGVAIPEEYGGQGLGMVELALVLEEMGRAAYPGPFFATVVLAASAIAAGGDRDQQAAYLPRIASGELKASVAIMEDSLALTPDAIGLIARAGGGEFVLSGRKRFVPFAHAADLLLVAARTSPSGDPRRGITVFAVERGASGLTIEPNVGIDLTNRVSTVTLDGVRVGEDAIVGRRDDGWKVVEAALRHAAVGASAEMLGAARKCLDMSVEYAKVREQFGQKIGSFQAIKHYCADMLVEVETAHAATYYAAWAQDAEAPDAALAASVAKSYVSDAARKVCGQAIQVHGGIGFTWDYDLHLYFKRAKHFEPLYGDAEAHRELVLSAALQPVAVPVLA